MGGCLDGSITAAYDKRHRLGKKNGVCLSEPVIVHPESSVYIYMCVFIFFFWGGLSILMRYWCLGIDIHFRTTSRKRKICPFLPRMQSSPPLGFLNIEHVEAQGS